MKRKTLQSLEALFLVLALLTGMVSPALASQTEDSLPAQPAFDDVAEGDWYSDAVAYVVEKGLMIGTGERTFSPQSPTSRGMMVTILHRIEGAPAASPAGFPDVAAGSYCAAAVDWAAENGIVTGHDDGAFCPDLPLTRQQMAAILYRYISGKGYADGLETADLSPYTDADQVDAYAREAMAWAVGAGIILGTGADTLTPNGPSTRAQVAVILMRLDQWTDSRQPEEPAEEQPAQSGTSSGSGGSSSTGGTPSGGSDKTAEDYSITALTVSGTAVAATVCTAGDCTLVVKILSEDGKQVLQTLSIPVTGEQEMGIVSGTLGSAPEGYFQAAAQLQDSGGNALSNPYTCLAYTEAYQDFAALTPEDGRFDGQTVLDFDGDAANNAAQTENFGVLAEGVQTLTGVDAAQAADGSYTLTGDVSLSPGERIYIPGDGSAAVLIQVGSVTDNGDGTITVTADGNAALADFYQFLKVDLTMVSQDDTSSALSGRLAQAAPAAGDGRALARRGDQGDLSTPETPIGITLGASVDTDYFAASAQGSLKIHIKMDYDPKLLGEDYFGCEFSSEIAAEYAITAKVDLVNDGMVAKALGWDDLSLPIVPNQSAPTPVPGLTLNVGISLPLRFSLEASGTISATSTSTSGFTFNTIDGTQNIRKSGSSVEAKIQGKADFSISLQGKLGAGLGEFFEAKVTPSVGLKIGCALAATASAHQGDPSYHACTACVDGTANLALNCTAGISYKLTDKVKGDILNIKIAALELKICDFYLSLNDGNDGNGYFPDGSHFGFGSCPNRVYRVKFVTTQDDKEVSGASVIVEPQMPVCDAPSGATPCYGYYLPGATFTATATLNGVSGSQSFSVTEATTVTIPCQTWMLRVNVMQKEPQGGSPTPLGGAAVTVTGADGTEYTGSTSASTGNAQFQVPNGSYTVLVEAKGFQSVTLSNQKVENHALTIPVTLELEQGKGVLSGVITDGLTNAPIAGAAVKATPSDPSLDTVTTATGGDGSYTMALSAGTYTLTVSKSGYSSASASDVTVAAEQSASQSLSLQPISGSVSGTVTGADDQGTTGPLEAATVTAAPTSGEGSYSAATAGDGTYTLNLPAGEYKITASKDGYSSESTTVTVSAGGSTFSPYLEKSYSGKCGNTAYWTLEKGVLTIYGTGELYRNSQDYAYSWHDYRALIQTVKVGDAITYLDKSAFEGCANLTQVTLPEGLDGIGDRTFKGCASLTSVTIPSTAAYIGAEAFRESGITSIAIPKNVATVGDYAFYCCKNLKSVDMQGSFGGDVAEYAFDGCSSLTSIAIPDGPSQISVMAFHDCTSLRSIFIPTSVKLIYTYSFGNANVTDVYYAGTEEQWNEINRIEESYTHIRPLDGVMIHYNSTGLPSAS